MQELTLSPFSAPGGSRTCSIKASGLLESDELVVSGTGLADDDSIIAITNVVPNTKIIQYKCGEPAQKGKAITFYIEVLVESSVTQIVYVSYTGDKGSSETYKVKVPLQAKGLTS